MAQSHLSSTVVSGRTRRYFNWPKVTERAEECACGLALAIVAAVAQLNKELRQQGTVAEGVDAVSVRMGVHAAVSVVSHMATPLPAARPSAFTTQGAP